MLQPSIVAPSRYRSRTGLRPFSLDTPFDHAFVPGEARHDRIKVKVRTRTTLTAGADVEAVIHSMAPRDEPSLFTATVRGSDDTRFDLRVPARPPRFLIAGEGKGVFRAQYGIIDTDIRLYLNPTRYWAHRPGTRVQPDDASSALDALTSNQGISQQLRALTLDDADNVLVGLDRLGGQTFTRRSEQWMTIVGELLHTIQTYLRDTFAPTHLGANSFTLDISPLQAECYWEFQSDRAIDDVAEIGRAVIKADGDATLNYPLSLGGHRNLHWVKLRLTNDTDLKIYAKTADRIRVEVTFLNRISQFAGRSGVPAPHTRDALWSIGALRTCAANALQPVWQAIQSLPRPPDSAADLMEFLSLLNSAVPEQNRRTLLLLLAHHHSVNTTSSDGVASEAVCRRLASLGVLYRIRGRRNLGTRYVLADRYMSLLSSLAS